MVGVIWYRFVRYSGTDWSDALVPIRRYYHLRHVNCLQRTNKRPEGNKFEYDSWI